MLLTINRAVISINCLISKLLQFIFVSGTFMIVYYLCYLIYLSNYIISVVCEYLVKNYYLGLANLETRQLYILYAYSAVT